MQKGELEKFDNQDGKKLNLFNRRTEDRGYQMHSQAKSGTGRCCI